MLRAEILAEVVSRIPERLSPRKTTLLTKHFHPLTQQNAWQFWWNSEILQWGSGVWTHWPRLREGDGRAGGSAELGGRAGVQPRSLVDDGARLSSGLRSGGVSGGVGNPPTATAAEKVEESSLAGLLRDGFLSWTCCFCWTASSCLRSDTNIHAWKGCGTLSGIKDEVGGRPTSGLVLQPLHRLQEILLLVQLALQEGIPLDNLVHPLLKVLQGHDSRPVKQQFKAAQLWKDYFSKHPYEANGKWGLQLKTTSRLFLWPLGPLQVIVSLLQLSNVLLKLVFDGCVFSELAFQAGDLPVGLWVLCLILLLTGQWKWSCGEDGAKEDCSSLTETELQASTGFS